MWRGAEMATPGIGPRLFNACSWLFLALAVLHLPLAVFGQIPTAIPPSLAGQIPPAPPPRSLKGPTKSDRQLNCSGNNYKLMPSDPIVDYTLMSEQLLLNLTDLYLQDYEKQLEGKLSYCVKDLQKDKRQTLGYAGDPHSLNQCQKRLGDGLIGYICRSSEIRMYFDALTKNRGRVVITNPTYCDYKGSNSARIPGCAPGFMAKLALDQVNPQQYVSVTDDSVDIIPCRSTETFACCPGFFCPVDLACMIPCPRGSFCNLSTWNSNTNDGFCTPYNYIPSNIPEFNKTAQKLNLEPRYQCGGADKWTDANTNNDIFCREGFYCNKTTSQIPCPPGSFCRLGETIPQECGWLARCEAGANTQDQWRLGIIVVFVVLAGMGVIQYLSNWILKRRVAYVDRRKAELAAAMAGGDTFGAKFADRLREVEYGMHRSFKITSSSQGGELDIVKGRVKLEIELEFQNLCLRLKRSGKPLLRSITGKLLPGQVTAVMGPSGAGKTTFLTAVAGKASNAVAVTGTVKINGKEGDLRNYRRVIGFVPQDDIVHSDLTVRENLAFSASYRLPSSVDAKGREKIIDRVTDMLGLEPIQHSLVGSVAKRGISGGQRKRVNVGMEMVMEPSVLILDEPTSGLDSTSSRLVIEALHLEALRGVNIGVVLHQPSYTIFNMFDNVMFLAKGGLVVYHGEVSKVEEYFASLGYFVPDKINPPDYYMDVLEGHEESSKQDMSKDKLALEWAKVNGFDLPEIDINVGEDKAASDTEGPLRGPLAKKLHFVDLPTFRETLAPIHNYFSDLSHTISEVFKGNKDLSGRKTPGFLHQFFLILRRCAKQRYLRGFSDQVMKMVIMLVGGLVVGVLTIHEDKRMGLSIYFPNLLIALSLLVMISTLPTFNADVLNYYRESASGINRLAFFMAKDTLDLLNAFLLPLFYTVTFYSMKNPKSTFAGNFMISAVMSYGIMGYAYIFSIIFSPAPAQMSVVMFSLASVLLNSGPKAESFKAALQSLTFARWALEAFTVATTNEYAGVYFLTRCAILKFSGFNAHNFNKDMFALIGHGLVSRAVAFVCLLLTKRDKQR